MKLIFTSYSSSPEFDRPEKWLDRISGYTGILESLGSDSTVVGIERINYEGEMSRNGVQYFFTRLKRKVVRFPFRLHRLIKELNPDVVFINGFIFPLQVMQLRLKLGSRVKIIILHRAERPFRGIKRLLQRMADRCVNAYLFTSLSFGAEWESTIDTRRKLHEVIQASSVFHPMDRVEARRQSGVVGDNVFLWVGRLNQGKDPVTTVRGFLSFAAGHPGARFYMIYQSSELLEEIKTLIESDPVHGSSIVLVGAVPHSKLQSWYNSADYFIIASHYEGSGVALSEAMSCGCIPITSDFQSFRKMTGDGRCGLIFRTGDPEQLTFQLGQAVLLDRESERKKVLQQFHEELSFDAIAGKIRKLIRGLDEEQSNTLKQ